MEHNTDAEYSGTDVSRVDDFDADESEWDVEQFVQSTGNECALGGCEQHTTGEGHAFCNFCWQNRVLPETDMSAFTGQADGLEEIDLGEIDVDVGVE